MIPHQKLLSATCFRAVEFARDLDVLGPLALIEQRNSASFNDYI